MHSAATIVLIAVAALTAFIGAEWAPTVNTGLIFLLALYQAHERRKLNQAHDAALAAHKEARDAKRAIGATQRGTANHDTGERRRWTDQ